MSNKKNQDLNKLECDVFVGYNSIQKKSAFQIYNKFKNAGIKVFIDKDLNWKDEINSQIKDRINESKIICFIFGKNGIGPYQEKIEGFLAGKGHVKANKKLYAILLPYISKSFKDELEDKHFLFFKNLPFVFKRNLKENDKFEIFINDIKSVLSEIPLNQEDELYDNEFINKIKNSNKEKIKQLPLEFQIEEHYSVLDKLSIINKKYFPESLLFINRYESLKANYKNIIDKFNINDGKNNIIVFVGSQKTGKTWLARKTISDFLKMHSDYIPIEITKKDFKAVFNRLEGTSISVLESSFPYNDNNYLFANCTDIVLRKVLEELDRIYEKINIPDEIYKDINIEEILSSINKYNKEGFFFVISKYLHELLDKISRKNDYIFHFEEKLLISIKMQDFYRLIKGVDQLYNTNKINFLNAFNKEINKIKEKNALYSDFTDNLKIIITSRQFNFERGIDYQYNKSFFEPNYPIINMANFTLNEANYFIDNYVKQKLACSDKELQNIKNKIFKITKGYPWFFHRFLRSIIFLCINFNFKVIDSFDIVRETPSFWYLKEPINSNIISKVDKNELNIDREDCCDFLSHIIESIKSSNSYIIEIYNKYFDKKIDKDNCPPEEWEQASELIRLGLINEKEFRHNGIFNPNNEIINKYFNPKKLEVFRDRFIELKF
ncbi:MAG: TIR domain-containing protein [Bacteroidales bacterium]|nr:TIR domain-containing protein [Bacteroidales bacterium]